MNPLRRITLFVFSAFALSACTSSNTDDGILGTSFLSVYRPDIQQGISVNAEKFAQLELGMTKSKVVFLLGEPPINDFFHQNRWDYIYLYEKSGKPTKKKTIQPYFLRAISSKK